MILLAPQVCTGNVLAKKHHHHRHQDVKQNVEQPSKVDELVASQKEQDEDPNGWAPMSREEMDAEFPATFGSDGVHHSGIYDFRVGHFAILDTPQKMDPEWQAEQHLAAVNALSGRRSGVVSRAADDDDDDE